MRKISVRSWLLIGWFIVSFLAPALLQAGLVGEGVSSFRPALLQQSQKIGLKSNLQAGYGNLPLSFEPNDGQSDSAVQFLCRGNGYSLFLNSTGAVLALRHASEKVKAFGLSIPALDFKSISNFLFQDGGLPKGLSSPDKNTANNPGEGAKDVRSVLRMNLKDASSNSVVHGTGLLPGKSNYFIGNDPSKWRTNIPQYSAVEFKGVYLGIDLVYYGNQGQLEYDFTVAAGGNPGAIQWEIEGAERLNVDGNGNLVLSAKDGAIVLKAPVCYQTYGTKKEPISSRYVMREGNILGFQISPYDQSKELVIDPILVYSTYLGGNNGVWGGGIAVDISGNAYISGYTGSTNFPTVNAYQGTGSPNDAFVSKLNASGNALIYSTYLGGSQNDDAGGIGCIAVDTSGNAYVTGATSSVDFPVVNAYQGAYAASVRNAFVTKLNSSGNVLIYSTYLGGNLNDVGQAIAIDLSRNAYVTGGTYSTNFPVVNAFQPTMVAGQIHAFVSKFNVAGNGLIYSTYLGGSSSDGTSQIAIDANGCAYVVGATQSTDFPVMNAFQNTLPGPISAFVTKFNAAGNGLVYSTYLGGTGGENSGGIAIDSNGSAYITGNTWSTDFPLAGPIQASCGGCVYPKADAFITKFNPAGNGLVYSTYLGGSMDDRGYVIAVDSGNNAYVAGITSSSNFPTANAYQSSFQGTPDDIFVAKLNSAGNALLYSTYLGGNNLDEPHGIALDGNGNAFIVGVTLSTNFPVVGPYQGALTGCCDAFILKLSDNLPTPTSSATPIFSPTPSPSETTTESPAASGTATPTETPTETGSCTLSASATTTFSPTSTPTASPSATTSWTCTVTATLATTATITSTINNSPSATSVANSEPPQIVKALMVPNPLSQGSGFVSVQLRGNAENFYIQVFTPGYTLVENQNVQVGGGPGYVSVPVYTNRWPKGLLYLRIVSLGHGGSSEVLVKCFLMR